VKENSQEGSGSFMKHLAYRWWTEDDGVLSFEWTMIVTLLCLGIVGGLAAARDAVIDELGDVAQAMLALDHSYSIDFPLVFEVDDQEIGGGSDGGFTDAVAFNACGRASEPIGQ
jgi:Flp pilus assembly pilin Flp